MSGETDLKMLLKSMKPVLRDGEFVFCTVSCEEFSRLDVQPIGQFWEEEGVSLILQRKQAEQAGLVYHYTSRLITLSVHSSLDAIGFLAAITTALAEHGISVNPVSGYYHDHLFVPIDRAQDAMQYLLELTQSVELH